MKLEHIAHVDPFQLEGINLLLVGSPTHGALPTEAVQAWIEKIGPQPHERARAAFGSARNPAG